MAANAVIIPQRDRFQQFFELGNRNFHPCVGARLQLRRARAQARCPNTRGTKERPVASRQRNAEKWFSLFRRLAQLPFRLRPSEIARWLGYLDISSWVILPHLSVSLCLHPSRSSSSCSLFFFECCVREIARRKLDAYYLMRCWRSPVSLFDELVHRVFAPHSLTCALSLSPIRSHALPHSPLLPHPFSLPFIAIGLAVCFSPAGKISFGRARASLLNFLTDIAPRCTYSLC